MRARHTGRSPCTTRYLHDPQHLTASVTLRSLADAPMASIRPARQGDAIARAYGHG